MLGHPFELLHILVYSFEMELAGFIAVAFMFVVAFAYMVWFWLLTQRLTGPNVWPLVGSLPGLIVNRNRIHDWIADNLKSTGPANTYQTSVLPLPFVRQGLVTVTANPRNMEHVLRTRFENYPKGPIWQSAFKDLLGLGIFNSDGDTWLLQRKTAALEFTTRTLRLAMARWANKSIKTRLWYILAESSNASMCSAVDLQDLLLRLTFDNICGLTFGKDPETLSPDLPDNPFAQAFDMATEATLQRLLFPGVFWRIKKALDLGSERNLRLSLKVVDRYMTETISVRTGNPSDDLLSRFMNKRDGNGTMFSASVLQWIALNFLLAGRDTSSVALSWFFWTLMQRRDIERKVLAEIASVLRETRGEDVSRWVEDPLEFDELERLVYLKAALAETLRLYPSVPEDSKYVVADDVLPDGTVVRAGSTITYSIYSAGRMESIWGDDCLNFKPERWLKSEDGQGAHLCFEPNMDKYRFVAFNAGPRTCLGKDLAYLQMKSIASAVLLRHRLELVPGHRVLQKMSLTLFMKNGLHVHVRPRNLNFEINGGDDTLTECSHVTATNNTDSVVPIAAAA